MNLEQCLKQYETRYNEGGRNIRIDTSNLSKEDKDIFIKQRRRFWDKQNKEKKKKQKQEWNKNNKEKVREMGKKSQERFFEKHDKKQYYEENKEKYKEHRKEKYKENKEKRKEMSKEWRNKNKDNVLIKHWIQNGFKHTDEEFKEIFKRRQESTKCELCNAEYTSTRDKCTDHQHSSGSFRNICCSKCNNNRGVIDRKMDKVLLELNRYFFNNS